MHSMTISYRRADVMAFWIVMTLVLGVPMTLTAAVLGAASPWAWGALAPAAILLPRLFVRGWFETVIWVWNGVARRFAAAVRAYALIVGYKIVIAAVGRAGSDLETGAAAGELSRWVERTRPHDLLAARAEPESWHSCLRECARMRGGWILALFPVVLLLVLVRDEARESTAPSRTSYTLY